MIVNHHAPLTPDRRHVKKPPPSIQITSSNFLVFYGLSHGTTLEKNGVAQNLMYSKIWWTISWNCCVCLEKHKHCQVGKSYQFLTISQLKIQICNRKIEVSTKAFENSQECPLYNKIGTWRRNCTILLPKTGERARPNLSFPKKPPHPSFSEWYNVKAHKKLEH